MESSEPSETELERQAHEAPVLSAHEQADLVAKHRSGDATAGARVVEANLPAILEEARARADRGLSLAELYQEGTVGVLGALDTFDSSAGDPFPEEARRAAAAAMDAALGEESAAVKRNEDLSQAATDYQRAQFSLRRDLGREPTTAEIAASLEWTEERTELMAEMVARAREEHDLGLLDYLDPDQIVGSDDGEDDT